MTFPVLDLILKPESYVCLWRNGELYIEPANGADDAIAS